MRARRGGVSNAKGGEVVGAVNVTMWRRWGGGGNRERSYAVGNAMRCVGDAWSITCDG